MGGHSYILGDPTVGIPCPMLNQWPDKFWHTSADTLDKVDPKMLARAGTLAATYAYFLANAGHREALWLGEEMVSRFKGRIAREIQETVTTIMAEGDKGAEGQETIGQTLDKAKRRASFLADRQQVALKSLERLSPEIDTHRWQSEVAQLAQSEMARAQDVLAEYLRREGFAELPQTPHREPGDTEKQAATLVPRRPYRGPVAVRSYLHLLSQEDREAWHQLLKEHRDLARGMPILALYWTDGQRTLLEIADLVELESGKRDVSFLTKYFEFLAKMGLVEIVEGVNTAAITPQFAVVVPLKSYA